LKTFSQLDLISPLQRALEHEKYQTPTPVQARAIPPALLGRDVLGCAQTGTGKTAAFALPLLNRLGERNRKAEPNRPRVLVLAPTRELAIQISQSIATYGKQLRLKQVLVYGGVNQTGQVRALNRGAHIVVATPGRLLDLMDQGHIELGLLEVFVLDEADRMLDMGFLPDLKRVIRALPAKRQSMFFSATLPPKIRELTTRLLRDPVQVTIAPRTEGVEAIQQQVWFVEQREKQRLLSDLLGRSEVERAIVFTRTKRGASRVAERLERAGTPTAVIHGNKSQNARQRALEAFRGNRVRVLVATDVAARGIDVDGISHVVNFDLPDQPESYVHRIGRTGRAGAAGIAVSFCSDGERGDLRAIEKWIGQTVPAAPGQSRRERPEVSAPPSDKSGKSRRDSRKRSTRSERRPVRSAPSNEKRNRGGGKRFRRTSTTSA
jgi:ATP-dependent RNA helicase RhlE